MYSVISSVREEVSQIRKENKVPSLDLDRVNKEEVKETSRSLFERNSFREFQ